MANTRFNLHIQYQDEQDNQFIKDDEGNCWFYKEITSLNRKDDINYVQKAALIGDLYYLLLGLDQQIARIEIVCTERNQIILSKQIIGYQAFDESEEHFNLDNLIRNGLAPVLVASFFLEERDLNWGNLGKNKAGKIAKIDHDLGLTLFDQLDYDHIFSKKVLNQFPPEGFLPAEVSNIISTNQLRNHVQFQNEVLQVFQKISLIDIKMIERLIHYRISDQNLREKLLSYFSKKIRVLQQELVEYGVLWANEKFAVVKDYQDRVEKITGKIKINIPSGNLSLFSEMPGKNANNCVHSDQFVGISPRS